MKPPHKVSTHAPLSPRMDYNRSMKNTHLEHLEDDILNSGSTGGFTVVDFLKNFGLLLDGRKSELSISTKWDGAPAIICGTDPVTGQFFVGTKSVFNKVDPKVCYSDTDIERYYPVSELRSKLKACLEYLPELGISGVVQGDLLFTQMDCAWGNIGDKQYITFTPNAITYAIQANTPKGVQVITSQLGIVFHTVYKGETLQSMDAVYNTAPKYNSTKNVFVATSELSKVSKFSVRDAAKYTAIINRATGSLKRSSQFLDIIQEYGESKFIIAVIFKQFFNQRIRSGLSVSNTQKVASEFAKFYATKMDEEIDKKKSEKGKEKYRIMKKNGLAFIVRYEQEIYFTVASYISIRAAKKMIIDQLNIVKDIKTFVQGRPSQPEGYVVSYNGTALKFVDDDFRRANITVIKSWAK
tara:strand:- start:5256 stop:6488 length:1233 start_codon:yes stop_codon:yes gene_type:complete